LQSPAVYPRLIIADLGDATTYDTLLKTVPKTRAGETLQRRYDYFGTVQYAAPEIIEGNNAGSESDGSEAFRRMIAQEWTETDKATDMWALGGESFDAYLRYVHE
jgi:serine/threonine protein kinase